MATATSTITKQQQEGVTKITGWYKKATAQSFLLAGYAGSGKTWLIQHIIQELGIQLSQVAFATFTGKASLVMTQKANGLYRAHTIHSLIYTVEQSEGGNIEFVLRPKEELAWCKLIVIDEWSMVSDEIFKDLESYGIPMLLIGDPAQLPPINESSIASNMLKNPDHMLTEIHRQAQDNPIIHLSMLARQGKKIEPGKYGSQVYVAYKHEMKPEFFKGVLMRSDQVICGYNKTRHNLNASMRQWLGFNKELPMNGDKLICTKNNWDVSIKETALVNGLTGIVTYNNHVDKYSKITLQPDFTDQKFMDLKVQKNPFYGEKPEEGRDASGTCLFDYGYAITCHKAQGSSWDKLAVIQEAFGDEPFRWIYTSITRSSNKLIYVINKSA